MNVLRSLALLGFAVAGMAVPGRSAEREENAWPFFVRRLDATGKTEAWNAAGPFFFKYPARDGETVSGFRPLWLQRHNAQGDFRAGFFLYPLFSYTVDENTYKWSLFELIRRTNRRTSAGAPQTIFDERGEFEIFPFWFSRVTGDPEFSYRGLFPVYGTVKNKLGFERLSWTLFPFYVENEKRGAVTTSTPWPFIRVTRGAATGFAIWPLYSLYDRPGVSRDEYFLWPLGYNTRRHASPDAKPGTTPRHNVGALPFYARSTGPGYRDENFLWPFFGYTDRTVPNRYHELRYFWPFLVQGRGDERYVNRWGPFYTHSNVKGYDKQWFGWPVLRRVRWTNEERNLVHTKTQVLYFLYREEEQRSATRPSAAPAYLRHVWPLYSDWDNGAGRRQVQVLSPLEVFFPGNEKIRHNWNPFFAVWRYEQRAPGEDRTSVLWNAVTWERRTSEGSAEMHVGPLLSVASDANHKRVAIGRGLLGFERGAPGTRWRMFWLDFRGKAASTSTSSR